VFLQCHQRSSETASKVSGDDAATGVLGDFDHFALDLKGKRLFLTAEDHKTVDVFDLEGKHLESITGFGQPHAALFLPESNKLIVTDGDDDFGRVELVSGEDYKILGTIKLPNGVDSAVFDPTSNIITSPWRRRVREDPCAQHHRHQNVQARWRDCASRQSVRSYGHR